MRFLELANQIRQLRSEREKDPNWDKATDCLIDFSRAGQTGYSRSLGYPIGKLLRTAYLSGTFEHSYFNDVRPRMIGADDTSLALVFFEWLYEKGFPIDGPDPNRDPFERLAQTFESIAKKIAKSAEKLSSSHRKGKREMPQRARQKTRRQLQNGPDAPDTFVWQNNRIDGLQRIPWTLLNHVWHCNGMKCKVDDAIGVVWGRRHATTDAVKAAVKKINRFLSRTEFPKSLSSKKGWFVIS